MRRYLVAAVIGVLVGLAAPVAAQSTVRLFGITSSGTILPLLINSSGYLIVWGS